MKVGELKIRVELQQIREIDIKKALEIYNSNAHFLKNHHGTSMVTVDFLRNELKEMKEHGFTSNFVMLDEEPVAIIDYMQRKDGFVYLSMLMLEASKQSSGLGRRIYAFFENLVAKAGGKTIRIDVVDDYEGNVLPFWEKMGFVKIRYDRLTWGEKESGVCVMEKGV